MSQAAPAAESQAKAVASAFLQAYYQAVDSSNQAAVAALFRDASTMSFEGATLTGAAAIAQKLTGLGLPPNPMRKVTATDAQTSCVGQGAIVVFATGEWMNQQYQEAFQLVPQGVGSYYIHNAVFRLSMANPWNVPADGVQLTKGFVEHWYRKYDGGAARMELQALYTPSSAVTIEGSECPWQVLDEETKQPVNGIMQKLSKLPQVKHDPNMTVDVQLINGLELVLVFLSGQMIIEGSGENKLKFSQLFILQKSGASYVVGNQVFRLNYG